MSDRAKFLPEDNNAEIREFILAAISLRANPENFVKLFHEDGAMRLVGDRQDRAYYGIHRGHAQIVQALRDIDADMERRNHRLLSVVIDGDCFALRRWVEMRHHGTANVADFIVGNMVRLRQGRIVEAFEYVDTASVKKICGH